MSWAELGIHQLPLFVAAGIALNATPGPDVLYTVTHALHRGARAGLVAALGISAGCLVHIVAATLGVSALLATSSTALALLKWLGAAYLVYAGLGMLRTRQPKRAPNLIATNITNTPAGDGFDYKNVFYKGFWTNVLNPKVALFFLAFVPQFIKPEASHPAFSFLLLGLLFNLNGLGVNAVYALLSAAMAQRVQAAQHGMRWAERACGAGFIALGLKLALSDNPLH